jgi:S-phase kinase-associated protein 1
MASESEYITLTSNDNASFTVERDIAERSISLRNLLDEMGHPDEPIPIPTNQFILERVLKWCTHHRSDPLPNADGEEDKNKTTTDISEWDQKFMQEIDNWTLFQLIRAAIVLDIEPLLDLAFNTVENMTEFERKSFWKTIGIRTDEEEDEIWKTLGIMIDITPEEKDLIRKMDFTHEEKGLIHKTFGIKMDEE